MKHRTLSSSPNSGNTFVGSSLNLSTEKKNELIATIMGFVVKDFGGAGVRYTAEENSDAPYYDWYMVRDLEYNSSWDWLMPVAIKCRQIKDNTKGIGHYQSELGERYNDIWRALPTMDIEILYNAIIKFIAWYKQGAS